MGFASVARVGACALTAVVVGDTLYSANLGDCKGIIVNLS
jgi:serine/threonine protein phosphatase PrpC